MKHLVQCRRGATAIEYGLFAGLAAIVVTSGVSTVGERIGSQFQIAAGAIAAAPQTPPDATGRARMLRISQGRDGRVVIENDGIEFPEEHN